MANLEKTLDGLESDGVITLAHDAAGGIVSAEISTAERSRGRENFDFYCFLIWPFVESAWLGAVSLMSLTPPFRSSSEVWLDLKQAQDQAQLVCTFLILLELRRGFANQKSAYLYSSVRHFTTRVSFHISKP